MAEAKKTILIAGRESSFGAALVAEARSRGYSVVATVEPERDGKGRGSGAEEAGRSEDLLILPWNRNSPFSVRNIFIRCRNLGRPLGAALIPFSPCFAAGGLEGAELAAVDEFVDREIKGPLFLARESAAEFAKQGNGILAFIEYGDPSVRSPLGEAAAGAFRALAQELFPLNESSPYATLGFRCEQPAEAAFAAFIVKTIGETAGRFPGRWIKYSGKQGFLSGVFGQ
jgi:NAD(P)-dependent dehydrogenase (short-subunit alcohol dehydrogenase family)